MSRTLAPCLRRAALAGLALLALAGTAQAQYSNSMSGFSFNSIHSAQADMALSNMIRRGQMNSQRLMMEQMVARQAQAGKGTSAGAAPATLPPLPTPATPGFRKHNLASALTLLLAVSQQLLSGQEYSDAQTQDYLQRLNDEVAAAGYFARLSAEQRTRAYDTMVITGGLIAGIAHTATETGDAAQAEQARSMARDALATFGVKHP